MNLPGHILEHEPKIDELRQKAQQATLLLKALANESRLMILCYLEGQELSVRQLNDCLNLSQSALSQHLAILRRDGLVKTRRESQTIYYSLKGSESKEIIKTLHKIYCEPATPVS